MSEAGARQTIYRDATPMRVEQPSFTCPDCGLVSYHPVDIREGWCNVCKKGDLERLTLQLKKEHEASMQRERDDLEYAIQRAKARGW
jgi:hypothetical protein